MQTNRNIPSLLMGMQTSIVLWETVWWYFYKAKHNFTVWASICTFRNRHTLLNCTIFCYTSPILFFFVFFFFLPFLQIEGFKKIEGNSTLSKSISKLHLLTSCLGVTFCKFLQYLFFFFTIVFYVCYEDLWSVIFDVITVVVLSCHKLCSYKMANLIDKCYVYSDCSTNQLFPVSPHCLRPPYSLRYTILKLGQWITLQWASKCSNKRKSHTPSPLNQKLEMIELSEEAILKAEIGQKLGPFPE